MVDAVIIIYRESIRKPDQNEWTVREGMSNQFNQFSIFYFSGLHLIHLIFMKKFLVDLMYFIRETGLHQEKKRTKKEKIDYLFLVPKRSLQKLRKCWAKIWLVLVV